MCFFSINVIIRKTIFNYAISNYEQYLSRAGNKDCRKSHSYGCPLRCCLWIIKKNLEVKMTYQQFQLLMIFWQLGLVDTFNVLKLCVNCGSQYVGIVLSSAAGNFSDIGPKVLLEPVLGLGTGYQFVKAAATAAERRQRIATLASFLAASGGALSTDPTTNGAIGAAVASKIGYMRAILARGGGSQHILNPSLKDFTIVVDSIVDSIKTPMVYPYRAQFTANCKININNMFQKHTARRYLQGSAQKIKTVAHLAPIASASTKVNTTALIGWTCFGVGIIGFITFGALYLFQRAERNRGQNQNKGVIIDVTASLSD